MAFSERIWSFVKRHRRKFYVAGAVVGGLVLLKRYTQRKMREWEENEMADCFERLKREQHFESTQKTCKVTAVGLMSNLHDRLVVLANCEAIREVLETKPLNKLELWEELKSLSFARIVAGTYGCCLLVTILNVQLNIIGGYMYLDAASSVALEGVPSCSPKANAPPQVQQKYLNLLERFLGPGLKTMLDSIHAATMRCVGKIPLTEKLTISSVQAILSEIRKELENPSSGTFDLFSLVIPDEEMLASRSENGNREELVYARLINETRDLFESDDCRNVLSSTLDSGFAYLLDAVACNYVSDEKIQKDGFVNLNDIAIPMAKIIPINCGLIHGVFHDRVDRLVSHLLFSEVQKTLGANIYEAFSQEQPLSDLHNHNSFMKVK